MKISIHSDDPNIHRIISNLLIPWNVYFTTFNEAEIIISDIKTNFSNKPTLIIPSNSLAFNKWMIKNDINVINAKKHKIKVQISLDLSLNVVLNTQKIYSKKTSIAVLNSANNIGGNNGDNNYLFPYDLINEYNYYVNKILYPKVSNIFNFIINFPVPYTFVPSKIRSLLYSFKKNDENNEFTDNLKLDALRYHLKNTIENITGIKMYNKTIKNYQHKCILTHDIETRTGLRNSIKLKKIEERYDVPSIWYIPASSYALNADIIKRLANNGEIGIHGLKHDGRLFRLSDDEMIEGLLKAKTNMEALSNQVISGFRAPLLQYTNNVCRNLEKSKYAFDSSIPTWEPKNPLTMRAHGIETVYPFKLYNMVEIPISIPQDYQMIKVMNYSVKETIEKWMQINGVIKKMGGLSTFLVHPDYDFSYDENLGYYEELVSYLVSDKSTYIAKASEVANLVNN